ncbi:22984_t:CDS:1, partial [Gigaspora rosea]
LAIEICHGLRPKFTSGTPNCYIELAQRCMDFEPKRRPTIRSVNALFIYWMEEIEHSDDENKIKKAFLEADKIKLIIESPKHSNHMYISESIDTLEISKRLEQYEVLDDL